MSPSWQRLGWNYAVGLKTEVLIKAKGDFFVEYHSKLWICSDFLKCNYIIIKFSYSWNSELNFTVYWRDCLVIPVLHLYSKASMAEVSWIQASILWLWLRMLMLTKQRKCVYAFSACHWVTIKICMYGWGKTRNCGEFNSVHLPSNFSFLAVFRVMQMD